MTGVFGSLLADLRSRGVRLGVDGDRLIVEAPVGTLTVTDRAALKLNKPEILRTLALELRFSEMSLEEFEQSSFAVEISVPWLDVTLWWVPRAEHAQGLLRAGIGPGRVYTARDLTNLTRVAASANAQEDIERVAKLKAAFGATILTTESLATSPADASADAPASATLPRPCPTCSGRRFWRSIHGVVVCGRCHPAGEPQRRGGLDR